MHRVVLDTSVIISAVYFESGPPADVFDLARTRRRKIKNVISQPILDETQRVLIAKFFWRKERAEQTVRLLQSFSQVITPTTRINVIADRPDNRILECAVDGKAHFIVSGDHHLLDLEVFRGIKILNPAAFLRRGEIQNFLR